MNISEIGDDGGTPFVRIDLSWKEYVLLMNDLRYENLSSAGTEIMAFPLSTIPLEPS